MELLLSPVSFPRADRGHRLDELVRHYAVHDRFRDVVVVTDPATSTLLLRALAPDQLPSGGAVTVVGLAARGSPGRRTACGGLRARAGCRRRRGGALAIPILTLPGAVAVAGLVLLLVERWRHVGRELLLAAAIAVAVVLARGRWLGTLPRRLTNGPGGGPRSPVRLLR